MIVYLTNVRWFRQGTDYHCHCEPVRRLVWQSVPLATCPNSYRSQGETDCHVAALLAMTGGGRTLAARNDHLPYHRTCGRGAQRMCVYHPKCVTHLPRALPAKRSFIIPNSPGGTDALTKSIPRSCQMIPEKFLAVFHKKIRQGQFRQQNLTPIFYNL